MQKRYDQEFKTTIVELYQSGQSVGSLASEYGLTTSDGTLVYETLITKSDYNK